MSLNYQYPEEYTKRPDWDKMKQQTYSVCMCLMALSYSISGEKTPEKVNELTRRVKLWEALNGSLRGNGDALEVLLNHWGLHTNVSKLSPTAFDKRLRENYARDCK
jgi:hypothetical protein